MATFKSFKALNSHVDNKVALIAQKQMGEYVRSVLRQWVVNTVYADTPNQYDRTYDFLNSLTIDSVSKVGNITSCSVYFDSSKIKPHEVDGWWNQHMSVFGYYQDKINSEPINEMLPYYLNYGTDSPIYSHEPSEFIEKAFKELNNGSFKRKMIAYLATQGINAK